MKRLLFILFLVPLLLNSQDTTSIEVCYHDQAYLQTYSVNDGPNQYYWSVDGGNIEGNATGHTITVNWLNVPYNMYLISVYVISDAGCYGDTSYLWVDIDECSFDGIYVPNSFTPGNDGVNDVFKPIGQNLEDLDMYIYNRWGGMIYELHGIDDSWDGTYRDGDVQHGVYVWVLNYKFINAPIWKETYGHVVVLR
jgi:gliding motility-associated-like protein